MGEPHRGFFYALKGQTLRAEVFGHIKNIADVLKKGLLSKNELLAQRIKITDISEDKIQSVRAKIVIPGTPYTLHDCVPMFFGARPPMLLAVRGKGLAQEEIVYVVVSWQILHQKNVWFTDGNARDGETSFFADLSDLEQVDFNAAKAVYWAENEEFKRRKQAEVLKLNQVLLDEIRGFIVYNEAANNKLQDMLDSQNCDKKIIIVPGYYYS